MDGSGCCTCDGRNRAPTRRKREDDTLGPQTTIAEKAFGEQYRKIVLDEVDESDPLRNASLPGS